MPPFDIVPGLAKRDASGQLLPAGVTGPEILNSANTIARNTIGSLKDELPLSQGLGKPHGETLKYPLEDANPAYQARVSFRMFSLQPNKPGSTQKILDKQTEDNLKNQGATSAFVDDTVSANLGGPSTVASNTSFADFGSGGPLGGSGAIGLDAFGGAGADVASPIVNTNKKSEGGITKFLKDKFKGSQLEAITAAAQRGFTFQEVKSAPIVDMYFPLSMQFADNALYDNAQLGGVGAGIEAAVAGGADMLTAALNTISETGEGLFDLLTQNENMNATVARLSAARAINMIPLQGVKAALTLTNRAIINPNIRALFRGVALREFTFQFKMIAESQQEAATVEKIVRHFRQELYPDTYSIPVGTDGINADVGFKFPNVFQIMFKYKGSPNLKLPKLHHCYLRSVNHTVNPTGGTFRRDGQPNEIDLTLSFVERKTLNKQDIKDGY